MFRLISAFFTFCGRVIFAVLGLIALFLVLLFI